jgi:Protein of unknown function (DUF3078)
MIKKSTLLLLALIIFGVASQHALAQDADSSHAWMSSLVVELSGAQVGFENWVEGGTSSLAGNAGLKGTWERKTASWKQLYEIDLAYGLIKQDTLDMRKAKDQIFLLAAWSRDGHDVPGKFQPTAGISFRSQFDNGYNYDKNPFEDGRELPVLVSKFMSPGIFQESVGVSWTPNDWFAQHVGFASKQTIILEEELRTLYGNKIDEQVRIQVGIDAVTRMKINVAENILYETSLGLFAAFNQPETPDTRWDNTISMQVNGWVKVTFDWTLLFDADVSDDIQLRETFGVGISYSIL